MIKVSRTVLIVEDSLEDREMLRRYLQQDDLYTYTVLEAETGEEGLEQYRLFLPDAILLDYLLPDTNGLEFIQNLQQQSPKTDLPVVYLTGQGNEELAGQLPQQNVQQYLNKSTITADKLHQALDRAFKQVELLRQVADLKIQANQTLEILSQREEQLRLALESAQIGVWDWDIVNDRLIWDDRMYEIYGIARSNFSGAYQAWVAGVHPDDRAIANAAIQQAILGKKNYDPEFRIVRPDGKIRTLKANAFLQRNAEGKALRMIGTNYDISEQKEALREREQAQVLLIQQVEQQHLIMEMTQGIRRSLNLQDILQTTVDEVRQYLQTERVIVFQFSSNWGGTVVVESVEEGWSPILSTQIDDPCFGDAYVDSFRQGLITAKSDIYNSGLASCHLERLISFQVRANLVVPILKGDELWGLLAAHHCSTPREWQASEIELLWQLAAQVSIAIQQADLFEQAKAELAQRKQAEQALQQLNIDLEQRVAERTAELAQVNDRLLETLIDQQHSQIILQEQAQLLDLAHDTIMTHDMNDAITFWNEGAEYMYGWTKAAALGRDIHTLLQTQFPNQSLAEIKIELMEQGYWEGELIHTCRNGSTITVDSRWVLQTDELDRPIKVLQINNDISDRKQAEALIRQQAERESLLLEISQRIRQSLDLYTVFETAVEEIRKFMHADRVGIFKFYPESHFDDGEFVAESVLEGFNSALEIRIHDHCFGEQYAIHYQQGRIQAVDDIYNAGLQDCHRDVLAQFQIRANLIVPLLNGEGLWGLLCIHQCDAPRHWQEVEIDLVKQISNQLAIAINQSELYEKLRRELQERQQAEAMTRESERRWRSLFESTNLAVVSSDTTGIINAVNPFFLKLTGYTESEVLGQNWFDFFVPSNRVQEQRQRLQENLQQENYPSFQGQILTKTGKEIVINWSNTLLRNPKGEVIGVTGIGEDITQRQAVEKLKDEFISIVSHELRTPLTSIRGSLGLLVTGVMDDEPEAMRRMIEIAAIDTERLVRLVNDMLDLEKLEMGKISLLRECCDAADLMRRSLEIMESSAQEAGLRLEMEMHSQSIQIWVSPDRIIQTFTNLLSNAIKFSPAGSFVSIAAEVVNEVVNEEPNEESTEILNPILPLPYILFSVKDRGRGIPADKLEIIFGRFQQVDASDSRDRGGTGLGLAICKSIVQQHGGQIWAESTWLQGSTFFVALPTRS
ncbi:PAS domain S-box protein [Tumidithrix helvetica PCC 7403]|uniref:PAS domain S-box protein n=1 Tax=Tumidithrix helvetica TaxID=3457545 RepID=UPI003C8DEAB4